MKFLSQSTGLEKLTAIRAAFRAEVRERYEHRALACSACQTPGICCRDEHFVNVHITRLEAADIARRLDEMAEPLQSRVVERIEAAIEKYRLDQTGDTSLVTYACPLFEGGIGCLVHETAKPLPCIAHACYERPEHLPPDQLLSDRELEIARLNRQVYGQDEVQISLPAAVSRALKRI